MASRASIQSLQHLAMRVENSRGRKHPEPSHPYRNDYQRDRDRIVYSRAFLPLENKTQVFTRRFSDHFRNRLTHPIDVAQNSPAISAALAFASHIDESTSC